VNDDGYEMEHHFISEEMGKAVNDSDMSDIGKAVRIRGASNYYLDKGGINEIRLIYNKSVSDKEERGFVLTLSGNSKKLNVIDITGSHDRGNRYFDMYSALNEYKSGMADGEKLLAHGHTHLYNPSSSDMDVGSNWVDYSARLRNIYRHKFGGNPSVIASKNGIQLYSRAQRRDGASGIGYYDYEYVGRMGGNPFINY